MTQKQRDTYRRMAFNWNNKCFYCGRPMAIDGNKNHSATIEHVIPLSEGGADDPSNFKLVHKGCNHIQNWLYQTGKLQRIMT